MRSLNAVLILAALLQGCGDGGECVLANGQRISIGQSLPDNSCAACSADGEIRPHWIAGCVSETRFRLPIDSMGFSALPDAIAVGPDASGDGLADILAADADADVPGIGRRVGRVWLIAGNTGDVVNEWTGEAPDQLFGSELALGPDVDGDGLADVLVGSNASRLDMAYEPGAEPRIGGRDDPGSAALFSSASGDALARWVGAAPCQSLGSSVALGKDIDADGFGDVLLADGGCTDFASMSAVPRALGGAVSLISGATGMVLREFRAPSDAHYFGANGVGFTSDLDGDGVDDVVVATAGPPNDRQFYVDVYSSVSGTLLHEWTGSARGFRLQHARDIRDADGDGAVDVLAIDRELQAVLLVASGTELRLSRVSAPAPTGRAYTVPSTSDRIEILAPERGEAVLFTTSGEEQWRAPATESVIASNVDLNDDGRTDIVTVGQDASGGFLLVYTSTPVEE